MNVLIAKSAPACREFFQPVVLLVLGVTVLFSANAGRCGSIFDDDFVPPKATAPTDSAAAKPATPPEPAPDAPDKRSTSASSATRRPIPAPADQVKSRKLFKEVFAKELADHSAVARRALAEKLIEQAAGASDVPSDEFVLLVGATRAAKEGSDLKVSCRAADALANAYDVDGLRLKGDLATKMTLRADTPAITVHNCVAGLKLVDELIAAGDDATAAHLLQSVRAASPNADINSQIQARLKELDAVRTATERIAPYQKKLETSPDDPAANLAVGEYLCFVKEDWQHGIPRLAASGDPVLKPLAQAELAGATTATAEQSLGDLWLAAAKSQTGSGRQSARRRAAKWYRAALPDLKGLEKTAVEKKLESVAEGTWIVLFRSADPSIWNTDTNDGTDSFAAEVSSCPDDARFLRLRAANGRYVIIPIKKDQLLKVNTGAKFNWNGTAEKAWGGSHLGITNDVDWGGKGRGIIDVSKHLNKGWGFGHKVDVNDKQYWTWAEKEIPQTVFEISVTAGALSPEESKFLLQ